MNGLLRIALMTRKKEQKMRQQQRSTLKLINSTQDENQPFFLFFSTRGRTRKKKGTWIQFDDAAYSTHRSFLVRWVNLFRRVLIYSLHHSLFHTIIITSTAFTSNIKNNGWRSSIIICKKLCSRYKMLRTLIKLQISSTALDGNDKNISKNLLKFSNSMSFTIVDRVSIKMLFTVLLTVLWKIKHASVRFKGILLLL